MAKVKNLLKFILCLYLIISSEAQVLRQATEREYQLFQELSKYGYVIMDGINADEFKLDQSNKALRKNYDVILIAYVIVKAACLLYKGIVALFGYNVSYKYTEVPMEKGYSDLSQKIKVLYLSGIDPGKDCVNLDMAAKNLCGYVRFAPTSNQCKSLLRAFEQAKYADNKMWGKKDIGFRNGPSGSITYVSVMVSKEDNEGYKYPADTNPSYEEPICTDHEKYFALFLHMETTVKISGNISVERKEEHWGLVREKVSSQIIETDRGVEQEDIETLFRFFSLVALKALKDHFAVDVELPQIKVENK